MQYNFYSKNDETDWRIYGPNSQLLSLESTDAAYMYLHVCTSQPVVFYNWMISRFWQWDGNFVHIPLKMLLSRTRTSLCILIAPHGGRWSLPVENQCYRVYCNTPIEWFRYEAICGTCGYRVMTFLLFLSLDATERKRTEASPLSISSAPAYPVIRPWRNCRLPWAIAHIAFVPLLAQKEERSRILREENM